MASSPIKCVIEAPNDPNSPPIGIYGHTLCYGENKMYLIGGWVEAEKKYNDTVYVFDFTKLTWERKNPDQSNVSLGRSYHTATYYEKNIYIVGGLRYETIIDTIDVLDVTTYKLSHLKLPKKVQKYFHSTVLFGDSLYIYGGRTRSKRDKDVEVFSKEFFRLEIPRLLLNPLSSAQETDLMQEKHGSFLTAGGDMYVVGGFTSKAETQLMKRYNIGGSSWVASTARLEIPKNELRFAYFKNEDFAVSVGGNKGEETINDIHMAKKMNNQMCIFSYTPDSDLLKEKTWGNAVLAFSLNNKNSFMVSIGGINTTHRMLICSVSSSSFKFEDMKAVSEDEVKIESKVRVESSLYSFLADNKLTCLLKQLFEAGYKTKEELCRVGRYELDKAGFKPGFARQLVDAIARDNSSHSTTMKLHGEFKYLTGCETQQMIGHGSFGMVYKGTWLGTTAVAMKEIQKMSDDPAKIAELEKEASVTQMMKHPNLITMYGLFKSDDSIFMVLDLCNGSVDDLLHKTPKAVTYKQRVKMCVDVATGMSYLASLKVVHRDLAARNLLYLNDVGGQYITRVGDLGLSRQTASGNYESSTAEPKYPKKWTPPEIAQPGEFHFKFSTTSDIWSYGVTLWEIFSDAATPYSSVGNQEIMQKTFEGLRLEEPKMLSEAEEKHGHEIWQTAFKCFNKIPSQRPRFKDLYKDLKSILDVLPDEEAVVEKVEEEVEDDKYE
ncbi:tyrosine protein kinase, putative [Entamoeba invadens IP1]|uniref:Tyrosine protein kinase, putative n=1 Tax=Entamoeba invadens IP1 TaxID=370355 RepID=A0A0A1UAS5_ENTIV|nr:tyrosine protein kinase, putative [Entamoeba invadens IP1]ELP92085.1 tyrosine protein kinase, putative [Entamoeba invadens IP1]|eukprot:XP_004258856.1 tyrosine protein kinase, putative [Entamoeba invadens IP1]